MKNILVPILCLILSISCICFSGCDMYKKYTIKEINTEYTEMCSDENLSQFFDAEDKDLKIVWSQSVNNEFNNTNSLFKKLNDVYLPLLKASFDSFYSIKGNITDKWEKDASTKVYNALADFRSSLKKFADKKTSFENVMQGYTTGATLTSIQKNHFDIVVEYFQDLISKSISLGEKTVAGMIKNNYGDFYSLEEFNNNFSYLYVKVYSNLIRVNLAKIAFNFDIKTSYIITDRSFLFDTEITQNVKNLNSLITLKANKVISQGEFIVTDTMKDKIKNAISNRAQMERNISNYMNLLEKLNVKKLQAHRENIPAYLETLSSEDLNNYQLILDFNNYYSTYIYADIASILNEI